MINRRDSVKNTKRVVVKIGSALLTSNDQGLDKAAIAAWVEQIAGMLDKGLEVVIVSSGAVAEGMFRLNWDERPLLVHELQVAAAVGQMGLAQAYEFEFQKYKRTTAQILLNHDDISIRERYLNARNTLQSLLKLKVAPIVNENDAVTTDEICFGDNDTLAAMTANLIDADLLIILTDQDGLFDSDPRRNSQAKLISYGNSRDRTLSVLAGGSGSLGRGGMATKLKAARLASLSGTNTIIANGKVDGILTQLLEGQILGTLLASNKEPIAARKQWMACRMRVFGALTLDAGAVKMLVKHRKSLLPIGVKSIEGNFRKGDLVKCVDGSGAEVARGMVNYGAVESAKIIGKSSAFISDMLGYCDSQELIHSDNLVLT